MMEAFEALTLDFYGTLVEEDTEVIASIVARIVDASPHHPEAAQVAMEWSDCFVGLCSASFASDFRTQRELSRESLRQVLDTLGCPLDGDELSSELVEYWTAPRPLPGAREFLDQVRLPICLVSNIDTTDLSAALARLGWQFDGVVTSEDCRAYKPRSEPFRQALSLLGCDPGEVLHVGDSLGADVRGALDVGFAVAWVNARRRSLSSDLSGTPWCIVRSVRELIALL